MCCYKIEKKQDKNELIGTIIKIAAIMAAAAGIVILIRALFKKFKNKTCMYCDENDCCECDCGCDFDIDEDSLNCMNEKECESDCDCSCKDDDDIDISTNIEEN